MYPCINIPQSIRIWLFASLLVFTIEPMQSKELYFSKIGGDDGLSESNVKTIIQDSYGFIWFGTKNGLDRYDGKQIKTFDIYDPTTGKNDRNVAVLLEDDNKTLWIGTDIGIFTFDPVSEHFRFFQHLTNEGEPLSNWVSDIKKDHQGNIWIVIPGQGMFKYIPSADKLVEYRLTEDQDSKRSPQCIHLSEDGGIWVGSNGMGIFAYNEKEDKFTQYLRDKQGNSLQDMNVYTLCEYRNRLIIGIHEGMLLQWNIKEDVLSPFNATEIHYTIIRQVKAYNDDLFIATQAGLFVYNESQKSLTRYREDDLNPYSLSDNIICSIYKDRENGIWIGTLLGGINYAASRNVEFEKYIPSSHPNSLSTKKIRELREDKNGNIWIGTENGGVNIFNPQDKSFKLLEGTKNRTTNLALFDDGDKMFVGYFKRGLSIADIHTQKVKHYTQEDFGLNEGSICALFKDSQGQYWLGNADVVYLSKDGGLKFEQRRDIANGYVYDIQEDLDGNIWFSTIGTGVYCYNLTSKQSKQYLHFDDNPQSLSSNSVSSITVDPKGIVWFSTDRGGICRYNKEQDNFTTYSVEDGFPDNVAYKILVDKQYNLWFGTNKGLVKFNPNTKAVRVFTKSDGLLGNQFSYKSALASKDGLFYFGGTDGLIAFDPYYEVKNNDSPPVFITRMYIYNEEVNTGDENSPLTQSLVHTKEIRLNYKQSNIRFDFAVLSYAAPVANIYAYKMDGIDRDWVYTHNQSAFYSQLPPGKYILHVKGVNPDGVWDDTRASISIIITPPWWKSTYAYTFYLLIIFSVLYSLLRYFNKKKEQKNLQAQKLFEIKKEHELYRAKVDFFTSIAHEIKTPLSLIKGPIEEVNKMPIEDKRVQKSLQVMELNTNRLLNLVNQLLDFRKIEANKVTLSFVRENVNDLIEETVIRFEPAILANSKKLSLTLPNETLYAPIDKEGVTKIISNLLNNALKYATHSIQLVLQKEESTLSIHVISDSKAISANQQEKIFEPFYQLLSNRESASGVGIGLSLARSIAELHSGSLKLQIDSNGHNDFVLSLPLHQDNVINIDRNEVEQTIEILSDIEPPQSKRGYTVMVVDDNREIVHFLVDRLSDKFIVITAHNGQEAIEKLKETNVHLIISDVMMPVMDGLDLCRYVKGQLEYSHIPVILLTAKNDMDSKIEGLETGADAYLEKPFSFSYLVAQVVNLLKNKEQEQNAFAKRPFFLAYNLKMNKADEEFMNKVLGHIYANMSDESLNVERLADLLAISRSVLHKKIKNLVDMAPGDFIRVIRLKRAAELIQEGKLSMAEISENIGISSPSYFSKLFYKQFGITPKAFSMKYKISGKIKDI